MPPKSPPMAFLPSPSAPVLQRSPERTASPSSSHDSQRSNGRLSNGVHSITSPSSLSQSMSRQSSTSSATATSSASTIAVNSYMEQSRTFLQKQRKAIDDERALFADERALWEAERAVFQARIKELEWSLEAAKQSNAGDYGRPGRSERSWAHRGTFGTSMAPNGSLPSPSLSKTAGEKFWEGPSSRSASVARTFSEAGSLDSRLQSIAQSPPPPILIHPDNDISPGSTNPLPGVDISLVNDKLDGIMLKATAVPPSVLSSLSDPSDPTEIARLRDAGHTPRPVVPLPDGQTISGGDATPTIAHQSQDPAAVSDSAIVDLDDDPALKGPLSLNGNGKDDAFLEALDHKLVDVIRKSQENSPMVTPNEDREKDGPILDEGKAEPEVKLRFKRSMNFGSILGTR